MTPARRGFCDGRTAEDRKEVQVVRLFQFEEGELVMRDSFQLPDLVDNQKGRLSELLRNLVGEQTTLSVVTAYFNIAALKELGSFQDLYGLRLLLGTEQEQAFLLEQGLFEEVEKRSAKGEGDLPDILQQVVDFLSQDKVQVRRYTAGFLHGKAYLVEGVPVLGALGIVGSSNFTGAGLTTNLELNAVLKQKSAVNELRCWFEHFWQEAEDYKAELLELLTRFTTAYTPYEVYIKILYEAFRDQLRQESLRGEDGKPSPIALANFQQDGYLAAKDILEHYGGVLIADSVGLGKTFLALRLLDDYAYHARETALVICPAQLRDTLWEPLLHSHAIPHITISMERISQSDFPVEEYAKHRVIVVDESHNFRNCNTNRWENLFRLLTSGDENKKFILLTATPVNNTVFDLYQQLRLISRDAPDFFAETGIPNLLGYFKRAEENKDALYEVLEAIAVRRSRQFIRKNYPDATIDGELIYFPERKLHRVNYSLQASYEGLYKEITESIENLNLAPYQLDIYRKDMRQMREGLLEGLKEQLVRQGWSGKDIHDYLMSLGRQTALVHIMKVLYLKRLESSVEALRISLERQMRFQQAFLEVLNTGCLLDSQKYRRWLQQEGSDDLSETEVPDPSTILSKLPPIDTTQYDLEAIRKAVQSDVNILADLCGRLKTLTAAHDDKLQKLKHLLMNGLKERKVVLFSYFRDTARYIYRNLREDADFQKALRHNRISIVDSKIKPEERRDRIIRFAPIANNHREIKGTGREIDLLISTDVLSEGQNLQDADTVINYDLHWNPVRMVQRVGRIDRIGSPHPFVYVYNFIPEDALESLLGIMERLYKKLQDINRTVGLDASILGEKPNPMDFNTLRRIAKEDEKVLDELEAENELNIGEFLKQELLDFLQRKGEEVLERMPIGIVMGTGKHGEGRHGVFASFRHTKTDQHYWLFYDLDAPEGKRIIEQKLEAIRLARSRPEDKRVESDFRVQEIITRLRRHLLSRLNQIAHRLPKLPNPQNQIVNLLQAMAPSAERNQLLAYFSQPLTGLALKGLRRLWRNKAKDPHQLFESLRNFSAQHPHSPASSPQIPGGVKEEDLELIGWIALC